jgi:replicative DNA helicase
MGKTALALSIMLNMILEGIPVGFFSLEMTKDSLYVRLLSILTKIPVEDVMRGAVTQEQYDKLKDAAAKLKELPLYIDDTPGVTAEYIRSVTYMWKRMHGIKCAFVDYIGLVTPLKKLESRERDVAHASQSFKSTAKKFNIPMVILSQLNRALEQRADRRPILSDLRESGSIEQDADVVIFVHRDEMYRSKKESAMPNEWVDPDTGEYVEKDSVDQNAEVIVAKQRNGKLGDVKMYYKKRYTLFTENR